MNAAPNLAASLSVSFVRSKSLVSACDEALAAKAAMSISAAISLSVFSDMVFPRLFKKFALLSIAETPLLSGGVFYAVGSDGMKTVAEYLYSGLLVVGLLYTAVVAAVVLVIFIGVGLVALPVVWFVAECIKGAEQQMDGY